MTTYVPFSVALAESLKDPAVRAEWERMAVPRELSVWLVRYRQERSMSQTDLAGILGMKQPAVARLESAEHEPSIATLRRLAERLGVRITLTVEPECIGVDVAEAHKDGRSSAAPKRHQGRPFRLPTNAWVGSRVVAPERSCRT